MRNKVLALVGTKRSRLPGDSEPPFKKPNLGQTSKKRAASSPSPKSVKISKIKQEPGLPKEHTNQGEQCFLMALEYYFLKRIETHVDLSTSNVQVSYKKCTEPVKTFLEHVDDSNKSPTLQLNKLQELFNHIASTPYAEVTVVTDLEFDAEPGASLNDQLACVQNGILEELRFEESQGNHIKWNELDYPYLLDIHVDLLNILYKKRSKLPSQSTMKRYEERNHAVLVAGCEGDMIIINDPNEGRSTKKEVKVSQLQTLAKNKLISIWTQCSEDTSTKPSRLPSIKLEPVEKKQLALQKPTISLHEAIKTGNLVAVQYYIDSGTDLNTPLIEASSSNLTPLHLAAQFGHKDILETLLHLGAKIEALTKDGWTPLYWATEYGHTEVANALLEAGAEVNATITDGFGKGCTPLHVAAIKEHIDIAELLLTNGADPTVTDSNGQTPLDLAEENTDTAELLHEAGETE